MELLRMRTAFILNVLFSICMYHNFVKKFYTSIDKEKKFLLFSKVKYKIKFYINRLINIFYKNNQKHFLVDKF